MTPWSRRKPGRQGRRVGLLALLMILVVALPGAQALFGAGDVVIDPTNLIQNTETAIQSAEMVARAIEQVRNQVTMISNQMQQIQHQLTNLEQLDPSILTDLQASIDQFTQVISTVEGLSYRIARIDTQFNTLYPTFGLPPVSGATYAQQQAAWNAQTRQALAQAMAAQSIVEHLTRDRSNLSAAVSWSQAAAGNLQVLQAGNQIQALVATQLMRLQQLSAASQRAQAATLAQQAAARDAARANADRLMQCFTCMSPTQPLHAPPTLGFGR